MHEIKLSCKKKEVAFRKTTPLQSPMQAPSMPLRRPPQSQQHRNGKRYEDELGEAGHAASWRCLRCAGVPKKAFTRGSPCWAVRWRFLRLFSLVRNSSYWPASTSRAL